MAAESEMSSSDELREAGQLGVEVVEVVQGDGLECHRQLRAAEFVFAVMADDHVF